MKHIIWVKQEGQKTIYVIYSLKYLYGYLNIFEDKS